MYMYVAQTIGNRMTMPMSKTRSLKITRSTERLFEFLSVLLTARTCERREAATFLKECLLGPGLCFESLNLVVVEDALILKLFASLEPAVG
mmetsp:Transcript_8950/g.22027  ORF Transcript_8950/g.22027 Transcript_8950/m.22027 type:complete len:91 (+) Transcript_8950:432-704(+)